MDKDHPSTLACSIRTNSGHERLAVALARFGRSAYQIKDPRSRRPWLCENCETLECPFIFENVVAPPIFKKKLELTLICEHALYELKRSALVFSLESGPGGRSMPDLH